jgi:transposase-like protein
MTKSRNWQELIELWESGGQSQRTFCEEHELVASQFSYWKRKYRPASKTKPKFQQVSSLGAAVSSFNLETSSGARVSVPMGFDSASLKRLLEIVG